MASRGNGKPWKWQAVEMASRGNGHVVGWLPRGWPNTDQLQPVVREVGLAGIAIIVHNVDLILLCQHFSDGAVPYNGGRIPFSRNQWREKAT
jgi:hypothetical protein